MDSHLIEIIILAAMNLIGVITYIVITIERSNALSERVSKHDDSHKEHYEHAIEDLNRFASIDSNMAVIVEKVSNTSIEVEKIRSSIHDIHNILQERSK
jgi:hypothetical protein